MFHIFFDGDQLPLNSDKTFVLINIVHKNFYVRVKNEINF
jgi:hypothetical protein